AVVGLSPKPWRPSHQVACYLQRAGYRIVPVNPGHDAVLGERSYPSLTAAAAAHSIDVVDVFRRGELAGPIVDEAIALKPRLIWLQVGRRPPGSRSAQSTQVGRAPGPATRCAWRASRARASPSARR